ncbi:MAG: membrane protein insertase YidC [Xanthomonadaceae bacterium]|nr:membrane protein insertase YidC [Xanthomonadaceae bacterium]
MDKRTLAIIVISTAVFLGWQKFYVEPNAQKAAVEAAQVQSAPAAIAAPKTENQVTTKKTLTLDSSQARIETPNSSYWVSNWKLNQYKTSIANDSAQIDLKSVTNFDESIQIALDDQEYSYLPTVLGSLTQTEKGSVWTYEDTNLKITRELTPNSGVLNAKIKAEFKGSKKPKFLFVLLKSQLVEKDEEERDRLLAMWTGDKIERFHLNDTIEVKEFPLATKWIAGIGHYFLVSIVNDSSITARGLIQPMGGKAAQAGLVFPIQGNSIEIPLRVYFGPKDLMALRAFEPTLDHTVDFGMFTVVAYPLLRVMNWLYLFTKNYGLAIIFLTILIKIITYPLTYKSMKSMKEMAKLQPQIEKLKKKYENDKEALNREMLSLMKTSNANPMMGCIPMLIQMPVFFALYQVLYNSVELYQTPFFFWIRDLSVKDPLYITPVLLTGSMWLQQKMTPTTSTDPVQQKMMQFMPVIFGAMMVTLPSGLTLYMLTNALVSIIQQMALNKKLGPNQQPVKA